MHTRLTINLILLLNFIILLLFVDHLFKNLQSIRRNTFLLKSRLIEYDYLKKTYPLTKIVDYSTSYTDLPYIYVITPTYKKETQIPDLIRFRDTLLLVPKLIWIVIEDSPTKTNRIIKFLNESNIKYVHLNKKTHKINKPFGFLLHKGVVQRNYGIAWLRKNRNNSKSNSVVYFGDDDNTYERHLFEEIRFTKKISVWPVGLVGGVMYEKPICKNGQVIDWFRIYNRKRKYPLDMAGFSVNLNLLIEKNNAYFSRLTKGNLEGDFIEKFISDKSELECKANDCSKIFVWHTRTRNFLYKFENSSIYNIDIKNQII